jgi:hypothetical protein
MHEAHPTELPAALRNLSIISENAGVKALTTGDADKRRIALEAAVENNPDSLSDLAALDSYLKELAEATRKAIKDRVAQDGLFKQAFEALQAGNDTFLDVYTAV